MIENNKLTKRTNKAFFDHNTSLIIEPIRSDFATEAEFKREQTKFLIAK